jgi:anti-sigma B factor antagonist
MNISTRKIEDVTLLELDGRLVLGEDTERLRTRIRELIDSDVRKILLNMGNVHYVDSSGVGELVRAYATVNSLGGQLKLVNLTRRVHDLLSVTKLLTVFESYENEMRAMDSFRK